METLQNCWSIGVGRVMNSIELLEALIPSLTWKYRYFDFSTGLGIPVRPGLMSVSIAGVLSTTTTILTAQVTGVAKSSFSNLFNPLLLLL